MNQAKEGEIVMKDSETKVKSHGDVQSKTSVKADEVKFWSSISNYTIATDGRNITFSNHVLCPKMGDPDIEIVGRLTLLMFMKSWINRSKTKLSWLDSILS